MARFDEYLPEGFPHMVRLEVMEVVVSPMEYQPGCILLPVLVEFVNGDATLRWMIEQEPFPRGSRIFNCRISRFNPPRRHKNPVLLGQRCSLLAPSNRPPVKVNQASDHVTESHHQFSSLCASGRRPLEDLNPQADAEREAAQVQEGLSDIKGAIIPDLPDSRVD